MSESSKVKKKQPLTTRWHVTGIPWNVDLIVRDSLPERGFESLSDYIRYLVRLDQGLDKQWKQRRYGRK